MSEDWKAGAASGMKEIQIFRKEIHRHSRDRVGKAFTSPPSEPGRRFSRTRLSSRWFPHRECLAAYRAVERVNSPRAAKKALGQR